MLGTSLKDLFLIKGRRRIFLSQTVDKRHRNRDPVGTEFLASISRRHVTPAKLVWCAVLAMQDNAGQELRGSLDHFKDGVGKYLTSFSNAVPALSLHQFECGDYVAGFSQRVALKNDVRMTSKDLWPEPLPEG